MFGNWHQLWEVISTPDNIPIVALLFFVPFYTWYAFRQAKETDDLIEQLEADPAKAKTAYRKTDPFEKGWDREVHTWPYLLRVELVAAVIVTALLMVWSLSLNAPLEEPSNPNVTMNPAKAPWYFLGLQEMLVYFDPWIAGVIMPTLIIVGLMVVPYIDENPLGNGYYTYKQRKFAIWAFMVGFIGLWVVMIVIGTFIRGPGWMWFWPTQTWDASRVDYAVNRNLDQFFGVDGAWIQHIVPTTWKPAAPLISRAIFGILPLTLYFLISFYFLYWLCNLTAFSRKIYKRMSLLQVATTFIFLSLMISLPIKIILRLVLRIKYVWETPWFSV